MNFMSIAELNHELVVYVKAERSEAKMRLKMAIKSKDASVIWKVWMHEKDFWEFSLNWAFHSSTAWAYGLLELICINSWMNKKRRSDTMISQLN
ncbi:hypothetical protein DID88_007737 [Monilinia fructigena]|uniref:Uncharacterized protein n=1 Tax=Monilinia fructigena TaxID=38457 RepID=A0A395J367_9HELO|nr:hypothetical protein DID88_007737 [Monilinia fructigena]